MALQLTYNSVTLDLLRWGESTTTKMSDNGRAVVGYEHVLTCEGYFLNGASATDQATDVTTILAKFRESAQAITVAMGGTTVRTVAVADCQGTGPWSTFSVPTSHDLKQGGNIPVTVTFRFITDPPTATGGTAADTYTDTYDWDKQLRRTYTRRGQLSTVSGTSAAGKFNGTDPAPGTGWELESKTQETDIDDQHLSYTWVYLEQHTALLTTALDESYTINSKASNGRETWTASGTLRFQINSPKIANTTVQEIAKLLASKTGWPTTLAIIDQDITSDPRTNTITFSIIGQRGYGTGGTLEYSERIVARTEAVIADHKAASPSGKDGRQTLAKPEVTITQTGRWIQQGSPPPDPRPILTTPGDVVVSYDVTRLETTYTTAGKIDTEGKEWTIVMRPLNDVQAGQVKTSQASVLANPLDGQTPSRKAV